MGNARSLRRSLSNNTQEKVALAALQRANIAVQLVEQLRQELIEAKVIKAKIRTMRTPGGVELPEPGAMGQMLK